METTTTAVPPPDNWREPYLTDHLLMVQTAPGTPVNITVRVEKDFRTDKWSDATINVSSTSGSQPLFVAEQIANLMCQAIEHGARLEAMVGKKQPATITENERKVLQAIIASEYNDDKGDQEIWTFTIAYHCTLAKRSIPGVVASLSKKGLVVCAAGAKKIEDTVRITDEGFAALKAHPNELCCAGAE
jgi:hypothetical protein